MKELPLTLGLVAIIDDADYNAVCKYKWSAYLGKYAVRHLRNNGRQRTVYMHQEIMGTTGKGRSVHVDHIDGNGLNNTRANLRICTPSQNHMNMKAFTKNKSASKYKGVTRHENKWRARIRIARKEISLGRFEAETDAALAYNNAAIKYFGSFALLNNIDEGAKIGLNS